MSLSSNEGQCQTPYVHTDSKILKQIPDTITSSHAQVI